MIPPNGINPKLIEVLQRLQYSNPGATGEELMQLIRNEMSAREPGPMEGSAPPLLPTDISYGDLSDRQLREYQRQGYDVTPELYAPGSTAQRYDRSDFLQSDFYDELANRQSQPGGQPIINTSGSDFDLPDNRWDRNQSRESGINSGFNVTSQYIDENPDFSGVFRNNKWDRQQRGQSGFSSEPIITSGSTMSGTPMYSDMASISEAREAGQLDEEGYWKEIDKLYDKGKKYEKREKVTNVYDSEDAQEAMSGERDNANPNLNPFLLASLTPDLDPNQLAYYTGRFAASKPDTRGGKVAKGIGIGAAVLGAGIDLARTGLMGYGHQKVKSEWDRWYRDQQIRAQRQYTPDAQYDDMNTTGGFTFNKYGGEQGQNNYESLKKYFSGGFSEIGDRALDLLSRFQNGNGGGDTTQTLEPNPNNGDVNNLFNMSGNQRPLNPSVMDNHLMNGFGGNNANALNQGFVNDTTSGYNVGQPVTFEYGGKMVSGTIKKIENGKIYV